MATIRKHRLNPQARRALELLDGFQNGAAEEFLTLSGFQRELLAKLVLAGFATVVTETVQTGTSTIKVERYQIRMPARGRSKSDARSVRSPGTATAEDSL